MQRSGYRELVALAWPVVLARSAQAVIGFSDAAMVAPLGENALAATTAAAINTIGFFVLPVGIVFIVQSFAAQLVGKRDPRGALRYAYYALILAGITFVLSLAAIPGLRAFVDQLGFTPEVRALMASYMAIRLVAAAAVVGSEGLGNWYAGLGDTRVAMLVSILAMVINVGLNWVLIYGNLGAPALGVEGAAWASVIASWVSFAAVCLYFVVDRGRRIIAISLADEDDPSEECRPCTECAVESGDIGAAKPVLDSDRLSFAEFRRMLRYGLPNGFNWLLEFSAFLVFINFIFADLGTSVIAALMAVLEVNSVSFMPAFGLASAGAILVGQAIGRGAHDSVPRIVGQTLSLAVLWQGLVGIVYLIFPVTLMSVFAAESESAGTSEIALLGASLLVISAAWQIFDAIVMTLSEALRAAGDTAWSLWARLGTGWFLWLPLTYVVVKIYNGSAAEAIWCMVVDFAALTLALCWRFRGGAWRRIELTGKSLL